MPLDGVRWQIGHVTSHNLIHSDYYSLALKLSPEDAYYDKCLTTACIIRRDGPYRPQARGILRPAHQHDAFY